MPPGTGFGRQDMTHKNPQDTILEYRRRRGRTAPIVFASLAVVLLVGGVALAILWYTDKGPIAVLPTRTPTPAPSATPGPASATPAPSATLEPSITPTETPPGVYTVQQGDTLVDIAKRYGLDLYVLMAVNQITDPTLLYVGQELTLPSPEVGLQSATPLPANLPRGTKIQHWVLPGETLQSIAAAYNSTVEAIIEASEITDPNKIQAGQYLTVPVNLVTPTPTVFTSTPKPATLTPTP